MGLLGGSTTIPPAFLLKYLFFAIAVAAHIFIHTSCGIH